LDVKSRFFLIKESPLPLIVVNSALQVLQASRGVALFFEQPISHEFKNLNEIFGGLPLSFSKSINNNSSHVEMVPIISKTGKLRWIRTSMFPTAEESKEFHIYFDDVTEDKGQFELAMQAKQIARIGSWKVDLVNNKVSWSGTTKEIHEVANDFVPSLEKGIDFYKKGIHRDSIVEAVSECMEMGKPFDLELIIVTAKGNEKWVRAIGEADLVGQNIVGLKGVFQDIDEIKKERLARETLDNRMRAAVQSANIGIWDWDIANNHLIWDENMFAIFGLDPNDFDGAYEAWEATVHPEDKERANFEVELALKGKKDFDTEFRIIKNDGTIAYIQARGQVFLDEKAVPLRMVGINTDTTRIKRKDERLRRLLELTEKQNQRLLNFAHIVSHNLRSNSSNISMLSGMLLSNKAKGRKEEFLGMIQKSTEQLEETLNQLNEIVRVQSTDKNDLRPIVVKPILADVCESINLIIEESGAKIEMDLEDSLKVLGLKPYLISIFLNLLTNSIKYRNPNSVPKIEIKAETLGNQTVLIFKDNGLGIDLKKHSKNLFGMYKTFHGNKDAKGVGLFMSKNQMEAMNGKIEVRSKVNKGSEFYLYFKNGKH
jgi:PAS domain S-box-containing protein